MFRKILLAAVVVAGSCLAMSAADADARCRGGRSYRSCGYSSGYHSGYRSCGHGGGHYAPHRSYYGGGYHGHSNFGHGHGSHYGHGGHGGVSIGRGGGISIGW